MNTTLPKKIRKININALLFSVLASAATYLLYSPFYSYAASDQTISAAPTHSTDTDPRSKSWFIYALPGGTTRNDSVTVTNLGTSPITLKVYPADAIKASDGGFALAQQSAPRNDIGAWITMSTSQVTLAPKEKRDISFIISIPKNATTEVHSGGIVFEETTPKEMMSKNMHINIISRVGVRVYETVPGDKQLGMKIDDFHASVINNHLSFTLTAEDTGTVHITPTGMIEVKDMFGRVINRYALDSSLDTFVPGKPLTISVPTEILSPMLGWDTAQAALYYSPTKAAVASTTIVANPWITFGILLLAILAILFVIVKNKLIKITGKSNAMKLAPHVWMIVGCVLVGAILFSWLISYLLTFFLTGK